MTLRNTTRFTVEAWHLHTCAAVGVGRFNGNSMAAEARAV